MTAIDKEELLEAINEKIDLLVLRKRILDGDFDLPERTPYADPFDE